MRMQLDRARLELMGALKHRQDEICEAVLARVRAIGASGQPADVEYAEGLRQAVSAAIDHSIESATGAHGRPRPMPEPILAQARLAARLRVPIETVLRRYLAGHSVLGDFVIEEAEHLHLAPAVLRAILRSQAAEADRVLAMVGAAYSDAADSMRPPSRARRRAESVRRLLDGELIDSDELDYDLDRWHVGIVVEGGEDAAPVIASLASRVGAVRLVVLGEGGLTWGWLGFREEPEVDRVVAALMGQFDAQSRIAIGEAGRGRSGWRLTHNQALAARSVALRDDRPVARYADVALVASAIQDELLSGSLRSLYLDPLQDQSGEGEVLCETLRAYFDANRNVTSAAAALGVSRNTVTNRLKAVEARIGHLEPGRTVALALALQVAAVSSTDGR